jgi:hypothetical protein
MMHHHFDVFKDPVFWRVMLIGIVPLALSGTALVWLNH